MELSPKQQTINEIKKAKNILVLGQKNPDGDSLGSIVALKQALTKLDKAVTSVVSGEIDPSYYFLPKIDDLKRDYNNNPGKVIKIDTNQIPVKGMRWQKEEGFLKIYLESEKNLKFEFIEIENGPTRPDLIIVVGTPDVEKIDLIYDKNTELFFETPIINIDYHPGNEYYGSINLVDLTASSTAEILVSLFEALGLKVEDGDTATNLLAGIIYNTQSFRNQNTTPKSLTVAAQLLAAGAKQQEIVSNFYKKKPVALMKAWGGMLKTIQEDRSRRFAWTKVDASSNPEIKIDDIFGAADDLLANTPEADAILILFKGSEEKKIYGKLKGSKNKEVASTAKLFGGGGTNRDAFFEYPSEDIELAEKNILKKISDSWPTTNEGETKELWDVIKESNKNAHPITDIGNETKTEAQKEQKDQRPKESKEDAIEEALKSISQIERDKDRRELTAIRDVIDRKRVGGTRVIEPNKANSEEELFEDE